MTARAFDAIIVGAGQAGPSLAGRLTGAGMKVALIERHLVGGTCVNTGCMPTKTLVASAYAAHMAALLGAMPLAIGQGVGAELRQPLGISIVGGLIVSPLLTLYTTPVVYIYLDRLQTWLFGEKKQAAPGSAQPAPAE